MKKWMLCLLLALCVFVLASCQNGGNQQKYQVVTNTQNLYGSAQTATEQPAPQDQTSFVDEIDFDDGSYDPMSEEDNDADTILIEQFTAPAVTPAPTMYSAYAGASPVVIDPIDKPTPSPLPALNFTYVTYNAAKLHLSFDGPEGWETDDAAGDTYILTNTDDRSGYRAYAVIRTSSVNSNYSSSELKTEVKQMLSTIKSDGSLKNFETTNTAARTMLDKSGVYANYTAATPDGIRIAGRVQIVCVDKVLYMLHASYPEDYRDTYVEKVFHKIRQTMKIIN